MLITHKEQLMNARVSILAKIVNAILVPDLLFIAGQAALVESTSGTGSWDGMGIAFGSLVLVPGLLVLNCWVMPLRWQRKLRVFIAGLLIPAFISLTEYLWLHGPRPLRAAMYHASVAPFLWFWFYGFLLFVPLLASLSFAVMRWKNKPGAA